METQNTEDWRTEDMKKAIKNEAEWLIRKCQQILENTDFDFNELGELQGNALNLDRVIIAFEARKRALKDIECGRLQNCQRQGVQ